MAAASTERSGSAASSAVIRSESVVDERPGHAGVGGLAGQLGGVHQVAVVAQRQAGAGLGGAERRLGVLPGRGAGRGVAGVADREVAAQAAQGRLVEDLADQPEVLVDDHRGAVGHRDAGRLLAAVLQGVQAEIGQLRDLLPGRPDTEDATGVLGSGIVGIEVVRQPSITARHTSRANRRRTTALVAGGVKVATVRSAVGRVHPSGAMLDVAGEENPMPSDRPTPASSQAQRMLASCSATHADEEPWAEATARAHPAPSAERAENLTFARPRRSARGRPERRDPPG